MFLFVSATPSKCIGGRDKKIHIFHMSAMDIGEWTSSRSDCFIPGERSSGTCFVGESCRKVYREVVDPVGGTGDEWFLKRF